MGEITQLEPVGWDYRHENVVLIKVHEKGNQNKRKGKKKRAPSTKRHLGNDERYGAERTRIHPGARVGPCPRDRVHSRTDFGPTRLPPRARHGSRQVVSVCRVRTRAFAVLHGRPQWPPRISGARVPSGIRMWRLSTRGAMGRLLGRYRLEDRRSGVGRWLGKWNGPCVRSP